VQMETAVLNVLLFLIIAVAGFGILAIFYMIVVEKTRDIGILKAIGASKGFIMREVVVESMILCAGGVVLGLGLSAATAAVLMRAFPQLTVELTWTRTLLVSLLGILAGAVGALYPAALAASKDPVEAIMYE